MFPKPSTRERFPVFFNSGILQSLTWILNLLIVLWYDLVDSIGILPYLYLTFVGAFRYYNTTWRMSRQALVSRLILQASCLTLLGKSDRCWANEACTRNGWIFWCWFTEHGQVRIFARLGIRYMNWTTYIQQSGRCQSSKRKSIRGQLESFWMGKSTKNFISNLPIF